VAGPAPGATLRAHERLRRPADFRRVFASGFRLDGPLFLLVLAPTGLGHDRLGLAASRKVGGAVERNRAKRLLRDVFRRTKHHGLPPMDVVAVPKPAILRHRQDEVEREYRDRLRVRAARTRARRPRPAPPD